MRFHIRALLIALLVASPLVAVQFYEALNLQRRYEGEVRESALAHARGIAAELDQVFQGLRQLLVAVSLVPAVSGGVPGACEAYLDELTRRLAAGFGVALRGPGGQPLCRVGPDVGVNGAASAHVLRSLRTRDFAVGDYVAAGAGSPGVVQFAYPVLSDGAEPAGVVTLSVNVEWIADQLAKHPLPPESSVTIADRNANVVVRLPERNRIGEKLSGEWLSLVTDVSRAGVRFSDLEPGRVVGYLPLQESAPGLIVAVGLSRKGTLSDAASWRWALLMVLAIVIGFTAAQIAAARAVRAQVSSLNTVARRWTAGDYEARTGSNGPSELEHLAATLDNMAEAAQAREAAHARVDADLRRSRDDALQASFSKSRFLAAASHDLRQPLQSMSMTVALLEMRHRTDADSPVIARLNRAVSNLADLLNTLLDLSQLEAGVVKPNRKSFAIAGLLNEISEEYSAVAESKGLTFNVQPCDFTIRSDPSMLARMMRNLVENAIRFTPAGGVIDVFCRDRDAELLLIVKDTGIGIPKDKREDIFRAFQQLNNPQRDRSKGLGLGLAIVDRMSRLLDHALHLESVPGEGSAFSIAVPKATASTVDATRDVPRGKVQGSVLLVEDDELVLATTAQLLEALGATVVKARSAEDALRRLEQGPYDLLIADYRLPGSSGIELVKRARERQHDIAAAIITGDPSIEELKRLVDFDTEVIQKPVRADRLARLFSKATHA